MKNLLLLGGFLAGLALPAAAQGPLVRAPGLPADSLTRRITFTGVVPVPGQPATELQARAREWVALTFQEARQATQLDDAGRGVLIVRGYTDRWNDPAQRRFGSGAKLAFTLRLDFRNGRYRYEITDLGEPLLPDDAKEGNANPLAAYQLYEVAARLSAATSTLQASPRQKLLQPDLNAHPKDNDVAARYGKQWPEFSKAIQKTVELLLAGLRQHETASPAKW